MNTKLLESIVVYLQNSDNAIDMLADLDSLVLFLNTNDFLPIELTPQDFAQILASKSGKSLISLTVAKSKLSKNQSQILDRYVTLYSQIQLIPSLDDDISVFEDDLRTLEEELPVVTQAMGYHKSHFESAPSPDFVNKWTSDIVSEEKYIKQQEQLLEQEKILQLKEQVLDRRIASCNNIDVQGVLQQIDAKSYHLLSLRKEYAAHEQNWDKTKSQFELRKKHLELTIANLSQTESQIQSAISEKERKLDELDHVLLQKTKDLRSQEKTLIQTSKQLQKLEVAQQNRENFISSKERELLKREKQLEESWTKLEDLKHDIVAKQHSVAKKEASLQKEFDTRETELFALYTSKVKKLEQEYKNKLQRLDNELDSLKLKQSHSIQAQKQLDLQKQALFAKESELKLLKQKYDIQLENNLDEIKSTRSISLKKDMRDAYPQNHTDHHNKQDQTMSSKEDTESTDNLSTIYALIDVATSEISINPQLAKKTYGRIHELYQHLPFSDQRIVHSLIIQTHGRIDAALAKRGKAYE